MLDCWSLRECFVLYFIEYPNGRGFLRPTLSFLTASISIIRTASAIKMLEVGRVRYINMTLHSYGLSKLLFVLSIVFTGLE